MRAVALLLSLLPLAAPAQDLTAQDQAAITEYGAAYQTFGIGDMTYDWDLMVAQTDSMLTGITGRWINAGRLYAGPEMDPDQWATGCGRSTAVTIERRGTLDFALVRGRSDGGTMPVLFSYVGARSFQMSVDMDQYQNFLDIDAERRPFLGAYLSGPFGIVEVFHPSPLILVIQPEGDIADIYLRCP
jgi:hypothetical protein